MQLEKIYDMFRQGDVEGVGASYLIDHYNRGRIEIQRPGRGHEPADTAWRAGRDTAAAGEGNPFVTGNMQQLKLERVDKDVQRVMCGSRIVGLAMRLASGKWSAYTTEAVSLTRETFGKPAGVLLWFSERDASECEVGG